MFDSGKMCASIIMVISICRQLKMYVVPISVFACSVAYLIRPKIDKTLF